MSSATAFPLAWPIAWPRTESYRRKRARFGRGANRGVVQTAAQSFLLEELRRLGATSIVLSTNLKLRQDGLPYANLSEPADPGVVVYFRLKGAERCFPCDRWDRVADNMYAIGLSIEALRGLDRWGAKTMVEAAFSGFKALPERGSGEAWYTVLGLQPTASPEEIRVAYKQLAAKNHPDRGGDQQKFQRVVDAFHEATASRGGA